ncbi:beta/gamma crystallin domain-containing protein [Streptomyces nodosus]
MQKKKLMSTVALAGAAAAAFSVLGPIASASAMSQVTCIPDQGYLKIWAHNSGFSSEVTCWANAGTVRWTLNNARWIDRIQTGNNDVVLSDCNGTEVRFNRWTDTIFPNRPPAACYITVL